MLREMYPVNQMAAMGARRGSIAYGAPRGMMGGMGGMADMRDIDMALQEASRSAGLDICREELDDYRGSDPRLRQGRSMRDSIDPREGDGMEERVRR